MQWFELDFLDNLYQPVQNYKILNQYKSIFKEISDIYYHENYHSDILAYYLSYDIVKEEFIKFLNQKNRKKENYKDICPEHYKFGKVERENGRRDITLWSRDATKAIIIENKSNDAPDMHKQVYRYHKGLEAKEITVEAILYLNKNAQKQPNFSGLLANEIDELKKILVPVQLLGDNSSFEVILNNVIKRTSDIRLNALSQEILNLFKIVVYGEMNMEDLESFVKELENGDNLNQFKQAIRAYNDLPNFFVKKWANYVETKNENHNIGNIGIWKSQMGLIIDSFINNKTIAFEVYFKLDEVRFILKVRGEDDNILENLKNIMGDKFFFDNKTPNEDNRYETVIKDLFDNVTIQNRIDTFIKAIKELKNKE